MDATVLLFIPLLLAVGLFAWWLVILIEALRIPETRWKSAGQDRIVYVLLMVFLGIIGTIAYLIVARPRLRGAVPSTSPA